MKSQIALVTLGAVLASSGWAKGQSPTVDYNRDVKPILAKNCYACHGPDEEHRSAGLRFDQRDSALKGSKKGPGIVPGKPDQSRLIARIIAEDAADRMPPPETGNRLSPAQVSTLKKWIEEGANFAEHWAFIKPKRPELPAKPAWGNNPIDTLILAKLVKAGLKPNEAADKYVLIRRASLDLRGLPPTPKEVEAFANDQTPNAFEKVIDQFLADRAYGERWARVWLDLARYADSAGYGSDPLRPNIWPYRDWVINALNQNLPYDRFTIEQLAGDLLPNATSSQKLATAFHRNTMTNTEGGTDDEEFRVAAVKDRADTTAQVWMGLTLGCAKCHNHKFDPITQNEYYRFYAIFNQTADADRGDESPLLPVANPAQDQRVKEIEQQVAELRKQYLEWTPQREKEYQAWIQSLTPRMEGKVLELSTVKAKSGNELEKRPDGSWAVKGHGSKDGKKVGADRYTITAKSKEKSVVGFKIEVPAWGGTQKEQEFALNRVRVRLGEEGKSHAGRIVRIELPGDGRILSLAEVQVFRAGQNIAGKGIATQSSTDYEGEPKRAIDGNTEGEYYKANSVTHTKTESNPWWEVKLAETGDVERIIIWNRTDGGVGVRLAPFRVSLLTEDRKLVWSKDVTVAPNPSAEFSLSGVQTLAFVDAYALGSWGNEVGDVLSPRDDGPKGWTGAPCKDGDELYVLLDRALDFPEGTPISIEFLHEGLAHFRISTISDPRVTQRLAVPANFRTLAKSLRMPPQEEQLKEYFRSTAFSLQSIRTKIEKLEKTKPTAISVPVMQELALGQRRKTHIQIKGDFLNKGDEVQAALPSAFHRLTKKDGIDRMALAEWIVSPDNPLTARVAVNRLWAQLFGRGLVETEEDFGTQGELPTHPELLDWLAVEFMQPTVTPSNANPQAWDTKRMLKLIMMSATYQQSSRLTPENVKLDPKNLLYSRAPRFRLEAEMVRDQALALSGLLSPKVGGPSVYPPQPSGLWQAAFNGQRTWPTSMGEDKYRRGLYTFWRRTVPYPSMAAFDAPSRETCSVKRVRTNTPLQAFVTLNDPVYVEAAQALARRVMKEGGATTEQRMKFAIQLCTCRPAQPAQMKTLLELHATELERFRKDAKAAKSMASDPLGPIPQGMDEAELAAWTVIANVLLNLDAILTRG